MLELRQEQQEVIDAVSEAFRAGHRRVMVSAACGFGKTELATAMLAAAHANGKRGSFVCDRVSLVNQTSERFDKYDLDHGVMMADHWRFQPSKLVQVCSIQTLQRRRWPDMNLLVVDEAHVLHGAMRKKLEEKSCFAIGLSATAVTKGLGKYFDAVVNAPPTNRLIERGLLVPLRIFSCVEPDMDGVAVKSTGEWDEKETENRALKVVGDVVQEYVKNGDGRKFICFAASIAHAQELARQFIASGINVATYTANDKPEDRQDVVQEFRRPDGNLRGLLSVEALTRGFDVAEVSCLILARPLRKALAVHVQMLGRVMRTAPNKSDALVLDHAGNCGRFWDEWNDLFEVGVRELDDGKPKPKKAEKKKEQGPQKCPSCNRLHQPMPFCPHCGHEYPKRASVEHVPGTLKELVATGNKAAMSNVLWPQVVRYALDKRGDAGRGMALALYKQITGQWPKGEFEDTKPAAVISPEVRAKITSLNIAWAKARASKAPSEAPA